MSGGERGLPRGGGLRGDRAFVDELPRLRQLDHDRAGGDRELADDEGRHVPPGTTGEIVLRPKIPGITMKEYFGEPEKTREVLRADGCVYTGDTATQDADGNFYFKLSMNGRDLFVSDAFASGRDAGAWVGRIKREAERAADAPIHLLEGVSADEVAAALATLRTEE